MNTRYQLRNRAVINNYTKKNSVAVKGRHSYDTRLQERLREANGSNEKKVSFEQQPVYHRYNTRNNCVQYEVNIDFDGASAAWNSNKRRVGQSYEYI